MGQASPYISSNICLNGLILIDNKNLEENCPLAVLIITHQIGPKPIFATLPLKTNP